MHYKSRFNAFNIFLDIVLFFWYPCLLWSLLKCSDNFIKKFNSLKLFHEIRLFILKYKTTMFIIKCWLQAEWSVNNFSSPLRAFNKHSAPASRFPAPAPLHALWYQKRV